MLEQPACLRSLRLVDSVGIDCTMPTRLNGPIIKLDLLQPSHLHLVKDLIRNRASVYAHFATPCGTASRAGLIQNGDKSMPPPLRNDDHPNGLPWLTAAQQERVTKRMNSTVSHANSSLFARRIKFCGRVKIQVDLLCGRLPFSNSCVPPLSACPPNSHFIFGSSRRKLTPLIHNIQAFHHLHQMCDNQHEHEPWGQKPDGSWATSEETAYTQGLLLEPVLHKSFFNSKIKESCVIYLVSQNRNAHCKPCVLPPTFSHPEICHH